MALKAVIDSIDDLDEGQQSLYREITDDGDLKGKFILDVEPAHGLNLENVDGLKSALGKERTAREKLERDVVKFKDIDPDKARDALAKLEELSEIDPEKEADKIANTKFEAAKKQLVEKHGQALEEREDRIKALSGQIDNLIRAWDRLPLSFADSDRFSTFAARIEQERGDFAKAIEQYRRARHASPWDRTALFRLGRALSNAGKTAEAAEVDRELRGINEAVAEVPSLHEELNALPDLGITPYPELCERVARNRQQLGHLDESRAWQALADRDRAKELASRP